MPENTWVNPNKKRFFMAAGVLSGLALAYCYIRGRTEMMDFEKLNDLDKRLYTELKEEVGDIDGIESVDINVMLDILKVVKTHEKYVHDAKLQ